MAKIWWEGMRKTPGLRSRSFQNQTVQADSCRGVYKSPFPTSHLSFPRGIFHPTGGVRLTPLPRETSVHGARAACFTPSAFSCSRGVRNLLTSETPHCAVAFMSRSRDFSFWDMPPKIGHFKIIVTGKESLDFFFYLPSKIIHKHWENIWKYR